MPLAGGEQRAAAVHTRRARCRHHYLNYDALGSLFTAEGDFWYLPDTQLVR